MTRAEKWLLAGLGLSLAINGLMAALIFFHPGHGRHGPGPDVRVGRLEQHLAPESRQVLRDAVARHKDTLRDEFAAMRQARDGIGEALETEPFDRARLEAAFAEMRRHQDAIESTIQGSFIDAAARLPAEERVKLARGGERFMRRMLDPGRRDRGGPPPSPPEPGPDNPR